VSILFADPEEAREIVELVRDVKKNPDVFSCWVGEGIWRRLEDEDFAEEIDRLDEALSKMLTENDR
jgi:hypothetical protein